MKQGRSSVVPSRIVRFGALALGAWLMLLSPAAVALRQDEALQLLLRTGFQPSPAEIARLAPADHARAVDQLVDEARSSRRSVPAPRWVSEPVPERFLEGRDTPREMRREAKDEQAERGLELQTWWLREMSTTASPLRERMTLFWHGHFASELRKVRYPQLMYRQNQLLHAHALGNFRELLHAISKDAAMLVYLDGQSNRRQQPNENYARELFELFTLGEGHYTEADVKEAARALSGWRVAPPNATVQFDPVRHDEGRKTILGRSADFDMDSLLDHVLAQPQTARFIVEKLWREFVSSTPDAQAVARLADSFRRDWEIPPLLKKLLNEPAFRANRGTLIKSPIELVVGISRWFRLPPDSDDLLVAAADSMGQAPFSPPNVKGWPSGTAWVDMRTLLARRQFIRFITGDQRTLDTPTAMSRREAREAMREQRRSSAEMLERFGDFGEDFPPDDMGQAFMILPPVAPPLSSDKPPARLQTLLLDPVYQLK